MCSIAEILSYIQILSIIFLALLEKVTWNNGTYCPGDPAKNGELIEVLANLTNCAKNNKTDGSIVKFCSITLIPNLEQLNKSVELCLDNPTGKPPYDTYTTWINGFDVSFYLIYSFTMSFLTTFQ